MANDLNEKRIAIIKNFLIFLNGGDGEDLNLDAQPSFRLYETCCAPEQDVDRMTDTNYC